MTNEPQRTSAGRRSKYSMEKKPVRVRRQIHMILEIFKLFEVANCKRTNSFFDNRMKQDNKLKGMNLETYIIFLSCGTMGFRVQQLQVVVYSLGLGFYVRAVFT